MYSSLGDDDIFPLILPSVCDCVLSRYNFLSQFHLIVLCCVFQALPGTTTPCLLWFRCGFQNFSRPRSRSFKAGPLGWSVSQVLCQILPVGSEWNSLQRIWTLLFIGLWNPRCQVLYILLFVLRWTDMLLLIPSAEFRCYGCRFSFCSFQEVRLQYDYYHLMQGI